jgi:hypothetical protein
MHSRSSVLDPEADDGNMPANGRQDEAQLLNLAPPEYVLGQIPSLLRHIQCHLVRTDPRRHEVERIHAQQLFTRLVDRQGQTVRDRVRGADLPGRAPGSPGGTSRRPRVGGSAARRSLVAASGGVEHGT